MQSEPRVGFCVTCKGRIVTTRGEDGRIKCDVETARLDGEIEETVLQIARNVYDANDFWVSEVAS